jgi:hypothetical protein
MSKSPVLPLEHSTAIRSMSGWWINAIVSTTHLLRSMGHFIKAVTTVKREKTVIKRHYNETYKINKDTLTHFMCSNTKFSYVTFQ